MILSCFAGSGKTFVANELENFVDLESSDFQWIFPKDLKLGVEERKGTVDKLPNEHFVTDYVNAIEKEHLLEKIVLIACQPQVLEELEKRKLPYSMVTPTLENKDIFIDRYKQRGNNDSFVELMDSRFELFVNSILNNKYADNIFILEGNQFLYDISDKFK